MPNWCDNQITITGPNSVIDKIEKIAKEEKGAGGLLEFFQPMPKELRETTADGSENKELIKKYGYSDWYGWATDNWGTKWDISEFYGVDRQDGMISFAFSSAWSPPIGAYEYFLAKNEECTLKAHYYEGGCDFMGIFEDGDDRCYQPSDYNSDSKFFESGDGWELDDYFGITESMAEWEAEQEAEKEDVHEYVKGNAINIGEEA
jgi:hypothetical protein